MLRHALAIAAMSAVSVWSTAGPLYGTVRLSGPSPEPVRVFVACPSFAQPAQEQIDVPVDSRGSFAMRLHTNGRCEMQLRAGAKVGRPFPVFVSNNPLRYDFGADDRLNRVP